MKEDWTPIISQLDSTRALLVSTANALPEDHWRTPPRQGAWSAAEVMAHLWTVETRVLDGAERVVRAPLQRVPAWKRLHLPVSLAEWRGFRVKSPIPLDPNLVDEKQPTLERLEAARKRTQGFIQEYHGRDLSPYRFPHPFFGSLNLYDWFRVIAHHEARHTKQLREIVELFQH
jgi:DinB family protein